MPIKVSVELVGILRKLAGMSMFSIEFDSPVAVEDVIFHMADSFSSEFKLALIDTELNDPRPNALVFLNKTEIGVLKGLKTKVQDGDKLVLVPATHGG